MTFRTVRHATGEGHLGDIARIEALASETGTGSCVVRIAADRRRDRRDAPARSAGPSRAPVSAAVTVGALVVAPVFLLLTPVGVAVGTAIAASGRHQAGDVKAELDRVLDAVDQHARPTRLGPDVVRRVVGIPRRV